MAKSIEPQVVNWGNRQIEDLKWPAWPEQMLTDKQIVEALAKYPSKQGGEGGGRPDHTIMLTNGAKTIPVFVEYKGAKGKLEKLSKQDLVVLRNGKNEFDYTRVISKYAVNGAAYYARNVVIDTLYKEVLAVGVNGFTTDADGVTTYEVAVYIVNSENPDLPIALGRFSNLSFLSKRNIADLFQRIADAQLEPSELHAKHLEDDARLDKVLKDLNQFLHEDTKITVSQRIKIVTAAIMAGIGVKDSEGSYIVSPLLPGALTGSSEDGETDGDRIYAKVKNFLKRPAVALFRQRNRNRF
jgi:VRR-NUC domain.